MFAIASMLLATACDNADTLAAPRSPAAPRADIVSLSSTAAAATGPGPLRSGAGALCADVSGAARGNGAAVIGWPCHGGANQQWALQASGALTVYDGALCLDVDAGKSADGTRVQAWACHGGANQRWTRTAAGELRSAATGKCLDLDAGRQGGRLQTWTCLGGPNQKWTVDSAQATVPTPQPTAPLDSVMPIAASTTSLSVGTAELPRTYLDTRMPTATGRTITVAAGADLQAALDAAQPGDVVALVPGASYVGNFVLRAKAGMGAGQWITVRSAGALPAEGTRVGPGDAPQLAKVLTPNAAPALQTAPGAQGWRLTGLEVAATANMVSSTVGSLVIFGATGAEQNTPVQVPSRLVIDRSYVHGTPTLDLRRCVTLNSASTAVIDSYVVECHSRYGDSQALWGWNGPGPFKIVNNHLEAAHEVLGFGGADPDVPNVVPSDIEIRRNHVTRPMSWRGVWGVKNLVEFKAGQRVLIEGNVFENSWADGQSFAFMWWSVNQEGRCTWCTTSDITFRYNRVKNVAGGFNLAPTGDRAVPPLRRVTIAHNTVTGFDGAPPSRLYQVLGPVAGVTIVNNSGVASWYDLVVIGADAGLPDLVFRNNVTGAPNSLYTPLGAGPALVSSLRLTAGNMAGNVVAAGQGAGVVPAGNAYASSAAAIGFADLAGGNLRLAAGSAYITRGVGSSMPGADIDAIDRMTQGVVR